MPLSSRMSLMEVTHSAVVDLQESLAFSEPFYVVVVEKEVESESKQNESFGYLEAKSSNVRSRNDNSDGLFKMHPLTCIHSLLCCLATEPPGATVVHVWKLVISSCNEGQEGMASPLQKRAPGPNVTMKTTKMCTQRLPLPDGVGIIHATPAAGHLRFELVY